MWHTYVNEKNRTSLDFHNHFANETTIKKKALTTPPPKKKSSASGVRAASPHWPSFFPETNTRDTRVKSPITEHVPIIEHFPIFSSFLNQIE